MPSRATPQVAARRRLVPALAAALGLMTVWALAASWYLVFHDEMLARFVTQQQAVRYGYEERLSALQWQIDRNASERLLNRDGIEGRLAALSDRQALIEHRQDLLAGLGAGAVETTSSIPAPGSAFVAPPAPQKPYPTPDSIELRMKGVDASDRRIGPRLAALELGLDRLGESQSRIATAITETASRNAGRLREAIVLAGLEPTRFEPNERGLGGPLVPVNADAFDLALAQAQRSTGDEERMRRAATALPFRRPIQDGFAFTSGFGTRLDPFTRGLALHTGLDLRAEYGTAARATASGKVTAAEAAGGYGNMVEIDHGHGLVTRYAHLSGYAVAPGQWVEAGAVVGRVGSSGRSTGNHLHYEVRIDGEPVDPQRFLRAGALLEASLVATR